MKPMLACSTIPAFDEINYPIVAQPKLDGIRCLIVNGVPVSRNLKPIPNKFVTKTLAEMNLPALDGELMLRSGDFNKVQSAIMSETGEPDFVYMVFDRHDLANKSYVERYVEAVKNANMPRKSDRVKAVVGHTITAPAKLESLFNEWLAQGYEGAIVRDPTGPYKYGRSTLKQGWMLKLKVFNDDEAVITGYEELMHNDNEPQLDMLGYQRRSSELAGQVPGDTLGALVCEYKGKEFKIGTGFTAAQRSGLWSRRNSLIGELVTFKFQELSSYGIPRFPVFKGIRSKQDVS